MLLNKALKHVLPSWLEIQFFYNRLYPNTKMIIDATTGGALMSKNIKKARELFDKMPFIHYQWQSIRGQTKKIAWVYEIDTLSAIQAPLSVQTKGLGVAAISSLSRQPHPVIFVDGAMKDIIVMVTILPSSQMNMPTISTTIKRPNNSYSNVDNPGWRIT